MVGYVPDVRGGPKVKLMETRLVIDFVQSVVGELVPDSVHTHFQLQRPEVRIRDPARGHEIVESIRSDVPDLLSLHGASPNTPQSPPAPVLPNTYPLATYY